SFSYCSSFAAKGALKRGLPARNASDFARPIAARVRLMPLGCNSAVERPLKQPAWVNEKA
ncbi:MAG: hypothetical protein AAGA34_02425, partial [Pseudomonadota bacterium]